MYLEAIHWIKTGMDGWVDEYRAQSVWMDDRGYSLSDSIEKKGKNVFFSGFKYGRNKSVWGKREEGNQEGMHYPSDARPFCDRVWLLLQML